MTAYGDSLPLPAVAAKRPERPILDFGTQLQSPIGTWSARTACGYRIGSALL